MGQVLAYPSSLCLLYTHHRRVNITEHMRPIPRAFAALLVCGASLIWAQQELTVQWKLTLQDLQQRLAALPDSGEAVAAWRDDAEALRTAIAEFARANPADGIEVPRA